MKRCSVTLVHHHEHHGEYIRLDGQHRIQAAREMFGDDFIVPAYVFPTDLTAVEMRAVSFFMNTKSEAKANLKRSYSMSEVVELAALGITQDRIAQLYSGSDDSEENNPTATDQGSEESGLYDGFLVGRGVKLQTIQSRTAAKLPTSSRLTKF